MTDLQSLLDRQRSAFLRDGPPPASVRRQRIDTLLSLLLDHAEDLADAISADFGTRARSVSLMNDIVGSIPDIEHSRSNVGRWMKTRTLNRLGRPALRADLQPDPLGVVGVIAPWNFPVNLAVVPTASALAAGNRVMVKMSEKTPRTAELFAILAQARFDPCELAVVTGGPDTGEQFSALPFDHLFFTGSAQVGQQVMAQASVNLVPVTLELGGKNPAVVDPDADIARAAERIVKARLSNGGQVCLCPDYALVPSAHAKEFAESLMQAARRAYPSVIDNDFYSPLVDEQAFDRVVDLIDDARAKGATVLEAAPEHEQLPDRASRKLAPTILTNVTRDMRVDSEEVFGPVLTIYEYAAVDDAIDFINARPTPLAAYWYGPGSSDFRQFARRTRSGGISRNDFALHGALSKAPFGGVGHSGTGAYHGKFGFDTFSHYKPVVGTDLPFAITSSTLPLRPAVSKVMSAALRLHGSVVARRLGP